MGGRGASLGRVPRVPNASKAIIADAKIEDFLLKHGAKHSQDFFEVGYTPARGQRLRNDLLKGIRMQAADAFVNKETGRKTYNITMRLGVTKKRTFRVGWIVDKDSDIPRLSTAHRVRRDG